MKIFSGHKVNIDSSGHKFDKINLVTLTDSFGMYDLVRCERCGVKGKRYGFDTVVFSSRYRPSIVEYCAKQIKEKQIRITHCTATGKVFANLTPSSIHMVIPAPKGEHDDDKGVWVMGVGEPVKVLNREFEFVK